MDKLNTLIVITGPTGVGKTDLAINVAQHFGTEIISADSRQIYRDLPIGTAAPTQEQLSKVKHHFVAIKNLDEYYSAAQFEEDALAKISELFKTHQYVVMCGGSMMYVDAVCKGIDHIPTISDDIRNQVVEEYKNNGIEPLLMELLATDPDYYNIVDKQNHKRVVHAVEICRQSGTTYTSLRKGIAKERPFKIVKIGLNRPRPELFDRINRRVELMLEEGLEEEARKVFPLRHLNSLNTVGYKEMFEYFLGNMDFETARERLKKNTRVYAKKQLTWFAKDETMRWCNPEEFEIEDLEI